MADVYTGEREVPCTVEGIRQRLEETAQEQFIERTVPELFFWSLGLEYVGHDIKFSEGEDDSHKI